MPAAPTATLREFGTGLRARLEAQGVELARVEAPRWLSLLVGGDAQTPRVLASAPPQRSALRAVDTLPLAA